MSEKSKTRFILYNPDYHEAVRETTITAEDVSDGVNRMSELYKRLADQDKAQIHLDKLLEQIAAEFEMQLVDHQPVPHGKGEIMMAFYKAWSMGMARYADSIGVTLI